MLIFRLPLLEDGADPCAWGGRLISGSPESERVSKSLTLSARVNFEGSDCRLLAVKRVMQHKSLINIQTAHVMPRFIIDKEGKM